MDETHRKTIQRHYKTLVHETNIYAVLPKLAEKNVFSQQMIDCITGSSLNELDRKRKLYDDIERRGPQAWQKLLETLEECGHYNLHKLLNTHDDIETQPETKPTVQLTDIEQRYGNKDQVYAFKMPTNADKQVQMLKQFVENDTNSSIDKFIRFSETPMKIKVKAATQFYDDISAKLPVYHMRGKRRGILLLINNIKFQRDVEEFRKGAEVDEANLMELFRQCDFDIVNYRDLKLFEMRNVIKEFASNDNRQLKKVDSMFVTIMSHGYNRNVTETSVVSSDGLMLSTNWIIEQFNNDNCHVLRNKPKVFLFQACRGESKSHALHRIEMDGQAPKSTIRQYSDMLIGYCTVPGFKSHRDTELGAWYIQIICDVFMEHAHDVHIEDLLKIVDEKMSKLQTVYGTMQTSMYENWGFKLCYLHPKLHA